MWLALWDQTSHGQIDSPCESRWWWSCQLPRKQNASRLVSMPHSRQHLCDLHHHTWKASGKEIIANYCPHGTWSLPTWLACVFIGYIHPSCWGRAHAEASNSYGHCQMILSVIGFQRFFGPCRMLISDIKFMYHIKLQCSLIIERKTIL